MVIFGDYRELVFYFEKKERIRFVFCFFVGVIF